MSRSAGRVQAEGPAAGGWTPPEGGRAGVPRCSRSGGGLGGPRRTQGWAPAAHLCLCRPAGRFQGRCGRSLRPSCSRPLALFGKAVGRLVPGKGCLAGFKGSFPLPSGLSREPELAGSSPASVLSWGYGRLGVSSGVLSAHGAGGGVPREMSTCSVHSAG